MNVSGQVVFITGGGSGIGLAVARAFLAEGNRVVISGRDQDKLDRARRANPDLITVRCDVTNIDDIRRAATEFADTTILVNNAGIGRVHDIRSGEIELADAEQEIETNFTGTVRVTSLFMPHLLRQPEAAIVTVSSALALVPLPALPVYSATKSAVHAFSTALGQQLRGTSVNVFDVLPTYVDTEFAQAIPGEKVAPEAVARAVVDGIRSNSGDIYVGRAKTVYRLNRISPSLAQRVVANSMRPAAEPADKSASRRKTA
jgi:uncharacterized oxidoreductase